MKVVITGASGNVGTSVLRSLTTRAQTELGWTPRYTSKEARRRTTQPVDGQEA